MPRGRKRRALPPGGPGSLAALMVPYLEWNAVVGYRTGTVAARRLHLSYFVEWCRERSIERPEEVTRPILLRYQRRLFHYRQESGKPLSWSTQHLRLTAIRSFFRWLTVESHILYNPASELHLPRRPHRLPKAVLTQSEAEQVINQPDARTAAGVRDRAILETLYSTGMRRSEIVALGVYDVDLAGGLVTVRGGKGGKDRVIPIGARAVAWIDRYLVEVRPHLMVLPEDETLFIADSGKAFHPQALSKRVKGFVEASGIGKQGSCHLFRHTMATLMLDGGADIRFIQQMLGHASISTTEIYTHVAIKTLKAVHERTHPGRLERVRDAAADDEATEVALLAALEAESVAESTDLSDRDDDGSASTIHSSPPADPLD